MMGSGGAHVGIFASHNALNKLTCDFVQSAVRHTACVPMTIGYPDKLWGRSVVTRMRIAHLSAKRQPWESLLRLTLPPTPLPMP